MRLNRALDWMGFRRGEPSVGVHLTAEFVTVAALRPDPIRLAAIGREIVFDAAVVDDDLRLVATLAVDLRQLVTDLGLPPDPATVIAIEPAVATIELGSGRGGGPAPDCPTSRGSYDRAVEVVARAGLRLVRVDAVPAALARLAVLGGWEPVAVTAGRWLVTGRAGALRAEVASDPTGWLGLRAGHSVDTLSPVTSLPNLPVPRALRAHLDLGRDGVAVGAAMAGFGLEPLVRVRAVEPPTTGGWVAQPVTPAGSHRPPSHERQER